MALCMDGGEGSKASWFGIYEMSERERELTRDGIQSKFMFIVNMVIHLSRQFIQKHPKHPKQCHCWGTKRVYVPIQEMQSFPETPPHLSSHLTRSCITNYRTWQPQPSTHNRMRWLQHLLSSFILIFRSIAF